MEMTVNGAEWVLYQRDDCHLCDLALAELASARFPDFESVFIDDSDELEDAWGSVVPVLQHIASGDALYWPFTAAALRDFLEVHAG